MKMTRRRLAAVVSAIPLLAASPLPAQTQTPPAPTPDDELKAARDRIKTNGETLAQQAVAMSVEPAFQFRA
jgi:hypothetical protein